MEGDVFDRFALIVTDEGVTEMTNVSDDGNDDNDDDDDDVADKT
jgi:hypothetical protein